MRTFVAVRVVRGSNFFNPTQPTKRLTQPKPAHRKVKTFDPQTNPTHNPLPNRTPYYQISKPSGTRKTVLIYHSQWKFIRYCSFISIYHYQVIRSQGLPSFIICGNVSDPRPDPTHQKAKNLDPIRGSTQPWTTLVAVYFWLLCNLCYKWNFVCTQLCTFY